MPMGQRAPTINMSKILRQLGYRTGQSRRITYYREPIYGKDAYGVENTAISVNEIVIPNVQAYIRTQITKDFVIQKGGGNIVGSALIYLPRLNTLKNYPNFDQDNNIYFNEIEGWDKIIDTDRIVYRIPTSGTSGWSSDSGTFTYASDGETLTLTNGDDAQLTAKYLDSGDGWNALEANRITYQIMCPTGSVDLNFTQIYGDISGSKNVKYTPDSSITLSGNSWLTIDLPYVSGTTSGSIYLSGTRTALAIASSSTWDYKDRDYGFRFNIENMSTGDVIQLKNIKFYKSIEWSVHAIRDYTDEYMCLECVRTAGKRDSLRRAYA